MTTWMKSFGWLFAALAGVIAIEIVIGQISRRVPSHRDQFLEMSYGHAENPERVFVSLKADLFEHAAPTTVQVGDSSGFHGVQPPVVEAILGGRYLNMSVFASQGYVGYLAMARFMLRNNPQARALVLYITPSGAQPQPKLTSDKGILGASMDLELNGPLTRLPRLPSTAWRSQVSDLVFYGPNDAGKGAGLRVPRDYPDALRLIPQSGGWTRERDNRIGFCGPSSGADGCEDLLEPILAWGRRFIGKPLSDEQVREQVAGDFGASPDVFAWSKLRQENLAYITYDEFRALAAEHGAKLVIVGAPVPDVFAQGIGVQKIRVFNETLAAYASLHPDVAIVPSVFWPEAKFSSPVHVATPYVRENSERVAHALRGALGPFPHAPDTRVGVDHVVLDETAPVYGFGHTTQTSSGPYRSIREGRDTALLFANIKAGADVITLTFDPSTPAGLIDGLEMTMNDEPLTREAVDHSAARVARFRVPASAWKYGRWAEFLLTNEKARRWPGDRLNESARGTELHISKINFEGSTD